MKVKQYMPVIDSTGKTIIQESKIAFNIDGRKTYNNPALFADFFGDSIGIRNAATEYVYVAVLNNGLKMIGCFQASAGSSNTSMFPIREILQNSLMIGGVGIAICHNHPTGNIEPSTADIESTKKLKAACDVVGLSLIDHVIVGANNPAYYSFKSDSNEI